MLVSSFSVKVPTMEGDSVEVPSTRSSTRKPRSYHQGGIATAGVAPLGRRRPTTATRSAILAPAVVTVLHYQWGGCALPTRPDKAQRRRRLERNSLSMSLLIIDRETGGFLASRFLVSFSFLVIFRIRFGPDPRNPCTLT
ncbi:hypothetical protein GWI33_006653 [Rhynchophorus ferrugineus]|uniref:Uncharacterized protein n=1 Tax=Rhynchophorus ferrugineus TaxID=354439 RepID=A0A834IFF8_RHYFE|nr:hypothetical protein GWI33_006653 [Rhynchophorus ferrugineus]